MRMSKSTAPSSLARLSWAASLGVDRHVGAELVVVEHEHLRVRDRRGGAAAVVHGDLERAPSKESRDGGGRASGAGAHTRNPSTHISFEVKCEEIQFLVCFV